MQSRKCPSYLGELATFCFETKPKLRRLRPKGIPPITSNVAERRAAARVSMAELRRRKLKEFDYKAYRAGFSKRYISTNPSADVLNCLIYKTLMFDLEETERTLPPEFPT